MLLRIGIIGVFVVAASGCADPYSDPFAMEQRIDRANNPFLHIQADPSQRTTSGNLKRPLRGDADYGAFEVEIGDRGAGARNDNRRLAEGTDG